MKLNRLIASLLDVSRLEMGQLVLQPEPMDVCTLVSTVVAQFEPALMGHVIEYRDPGEPVVVIGDAMRLEQVLQNLLQNAVKYSPGASEIRVEVAQHGGDVTVTVSDNGIGIPQDALPRLFERFYRAPNSEMHHIAGIGMGLYVVKEIVDLHGGSVTVESREGAGSTFTVRLPAAEEKMLAEAYAG